MLTLQSSVTFASFNHSTMYPPSFVRNSAAIPSNSIAFHPSKRTPNLLPSITVTLIPLISKIPHHSTVFLHFPIIPDIQMPLKYFFRLILISTSSLNIKPFTFFDYLIVPSPMQFLIFPLINYLLAFSPTPILLFSYGVLCPYSLSTLLFSFSFRYGL